MYQKYHTGFMAPDPLDVGEAETIEPEIWNVILAAEKRKINGERNQYCETRGRRLQPLGIYHLQSIFRMIHQVWLLHPKMGQFQ